MSELREQMTAQMKIRGFSERTQEIYLKCMIKFVKHFMIPPNRINHKQVYEYQKYLVYEKDASYCFFNQSVCAIRFFYNRVLNRKWMIEHIPFQKKDFIFLPF